MSLRPPEGQLAWTSKCGGHWRRRCADTSSLPFPAEVRFERRCSDVGGTVSDCRRVGGGADL